MGQHMLTPPEIGFLDRDKTGRNARGSNHRLSGSFQGANAHPFICTGAGSTTTLVGAAANLATSLNCLRLGERFKIFNSAGNPKEDTVFTVTAHNGTTTVTFTPAAAVATASGDTARMVGADAFASSNDLDNFLINTGVYTQLQLDKMTMNDKIYAVRLALDPDQWRPTA